MNLGMRFLTAKDVEVLRRPPIEELTAEKRQAILTAPLPQRVLPETNVPERLPEIEEEEARPEDLAAMGLGPEADAPPLIATPPEEAVAPMVAPNLAANQPGAFTFVPTVMQPPPQQQGELQEVGEENIPLAPGDPVVLGGPAPQQGAVSVQTTNQPVMVIPMSVAQQPPPAQLLPPPAPGLPATLAVDTSAQARQAQGIVSAAPRLPNRPNSPRRAASFSQAASSSGATVAVNKLGAVSDAPVASGNPNVRVTVNKQV